MCNDGSVCECSEVTANATDLGLVIDISVSGDTTSHMWKCWCCRGSNRNAEISIAKCPANKPRMCLNNSRDDYLSSEETINYSCADAMEVDMSIATRDDDGDTGTATIKRYAGLSMAGFTHAFLCADADSQCTPRFC